MIKLIEFIQTEIKPQYKAFDGAHNEKHCQEVIDKAMDLARIYNLEDGSLSIVYTAAAYHDLGLALSREDHHTESASIVLRDDRLLDFMSKEDRILVASAVLNHRFSTGKPSNLYDQIIYSADRDIDLTEMFRRAVSFAVARESLLEKALNNAYTHLYDKYGKKEPSEMLNLLPETKQALTDIYYRLQDKNLCFAIMRSVGLDF